MKLNINTNIIKAINIIEESGHEAYLVGGAVRDYLLDLEPKDYDLATNLDLDTLIEIFKDYKPNKYKSKGITVSVIINGTYIEITKYKGLTIDEDLSNRDYTINSMAYHPNKGVLDPFGGYLDLSNKTLKTTKDPKTVFEDDPIRILRGIRLSSVYDLNASSDLINKMNEYSYLLLKSNKERYQQEINTILTSKIPSKYIRDYYKVFFIVFPNLKDCYKLNQHNKKWHHLDVFEHTLKVLDSTKNNLILRLAALLHDIGKPKCFTIDDKGIGHFYKHELVSEEIARENLLDLKYNSITINRVCHLIKYHDRKLSKNESSLLKFLYTFGTNDLDLYFGLRRADILGQNPELLDRIYEIDEITEIIRQILNSNKIITYKNLKIKGSDLKSLGYSDKSIGKALDIILKPVIEKRIKNDYDKLMAYAAKLKYDIND